jgi:hypothetical protein
MFWIAGAGNFFLVGGRKKIKTSTSDQVLISVQQEENSMIIPKVTFTLDGI